MDKKKNLRVLVLDDDKFMLEFVSHLLRELGVNEVLVAENGAAGLFALSAQIEVVDLLICDIEMPGMDGIEFLRHIADQKYSGKVVLFSDVEADLLKAIERLAIVRGLNVVGTLAKPVTMGSLTAILEKLSLPIQKTTNSSQVRQIFDVEEIRQALMADQITLFFQPKISASSRRVTSVECLARWHHARYGYISPDNFISIIEQNGLINDFTRNVLKKSVQQLDIWLQNGLDLEISVNVSMANLDRFDLPEIYQEAVQDSNVPIERVTLEITEGKLGKDFAQSLDILTRIRLKGFGLSIDDFGTGYASMETLKYMPFTELKIDRIFAHNAAQDSATRVILESSIKLGKAFGLNVVVEGIENQADCELVTELGCDEIQGYFIAQPMLADEFARWLCDYEKNRK
ncbi:EAL domain-containing protein (putative c-di-GMP-specific phosphodiesterase class I) [Nitrosomonas sp. Nm84]|uniref:EAL domain-containing response regulator n=1 Tax=Nitrosomonas sp. Nm84 TaxID=200124 RepID=UPI000D7651F2|nr:EAL domain-containing response regulator [Nitrosomonas sp. Nm84]PXW86441.1 EAL domain-containing protein (putative c-di-GMP-specific phosphodiesterase class I) [Nitrosomonas sp. Nm84]